jgi:hypothetical protein
VIYLKLPTQNKYKIKLKTLLVDEATSTPTEAQYTQLEPCRKQHEECTIYPEEDEELGRSTEFASGD